VQAKVCEGSPVGSPVCKQWWSTTITNTFTYNSYSSVNTAKD